MGGFEQLASATPSSMFSDQADDIKEEPYQMFSDQADDVKEEPYQMVKVEMNDD